MRTPALRLIATLVVLVSVFAQPCLAATPAHFWSLNSGSNDDATVSMVVIVPSNGDIIVTGYFYGPMDLGTGVLVPDQTFGTGTDDIFIARFNRAGQVKWAKSFGGYQLDAGAGVGVDGSGNVYLLANISGLTDFGGGDLAGDIALVKFDANGNHLWSHTYSSSGNGISGTRLAVDAAGNVIICGAFEGTANFGGTDVSSLGSSDGFVAKYNSAGVFQWNQIVTGNGQQVAYALATDGASNIYVTGYFSTEVTFSGFSPLTSAGGLDLFMAKLNAAGSIQWTQKRGGTGDEIGLAISSDAAGNIALGGGFHDTVSFGGNALVSAGGFDGFIARYNTSGAHQWSLRFGTAGEIEAAYGVVINSVQKVFFSGISQSDLNGTPGNGGTDILMAKYASNGSLLWSRIVGGAGDDAGYTMGVDVGDNVVVGGTFQDAVDFGGGNRKALGRTDLFIARYGLGEPAITTIKDVGNDQGRNVRITLTRSPLDDGSAALPITEYQAWRRILPLPAGLSSRAGGPQALPSGTWEYVSSIPASNLTSYRMVTSTLADSTVNYGMYRTKFFVRAATANPSIFFDSPVDSGYSVDNLAPSVPANFVLNNSNLTWDKSAAEDFDYFSVYGSNTDSFGSASLIDYTVSPALDVSASPYNYYWVTATDFSGNEGKPAKARSTTGVGEGAMPHVLSVSAYPNPFNPETTVRYTLPARSHVRVDIYDLRGERVATLVDRDQEAGAFTVTWRGQDDRGGRAGSGIYFAKLSSQSGVRTYKLTLLK